MHPAPPSQGAAPAPPDPMQSLAAHLDDVMAQAEIAANAQRDLETEADNPTAPSERQEEPEPDDDEDEDEQQEGETPESEPAPEAPDETEEQPELSPPERRPDEEREREPRPQPAAAETPRYSRRDAARFAAELEQTKAQLAQAQAQFNNSIGELHHFQNNRQVILNHLQQQSGYVREANGRFRYENLSEKTLRGQATVDEADEVAQMTSWQEFAAPIFHAAEDMVLRAFSVDWNTLGNLDGVGDEGLKRLNAHTNPIAAVREVHTLALAAGEAKAAQKYESQLAKLRAENKSLRTGQVARSPQPASANGAAVPSNPRLYGACDRSENRHDHRRNRSGGSRRQVARC